MQSLEDKFFLGAKTHLLTMKETVAWIDERISASIFTQHSVVNVAKIVNMQVDASLAESVNACDIVNIDGMGVVWGARLFGLAVPERVSGIDLFDQLLSLSVSRRYPVYFLGATDDVVRAAVERAQEQHPGLDIAGFHHGYFWDNQEQVVNIIKASGAKLLFVAITSPMKEVFINQWKCALGVDFVMGVGGTFDVYAGKVKRAPIWMQHAGLEWFYRVLQEPRRMWRRYLTTNIKFLWLLIARRLRL
ncbi:MAG: WecB/TagA/CpsF family glycosyltransferase [Moraxellaceae bacterium]|nr:WecB/TagA/CpsF family glycosyltransferase [Moraxellaceae bacterium]